MKTASWVIKNKKTGEIIFETFEQSTVNAINTDKFEAVPILKHLQSLNAPADDDWEGAEAEAELADFAQD